MKKISVDAYKFLINNIAGSGQFWSCVLCDGQGNTRDSIVHTSECEVGKAIEEAKPVNALYLATVNAPMERVQVTGETDKGFHVLFANGTEGFVSRHIAFKTKAEAKAAVLIDLSAQIGHYQHEADVRKKLLRTIENTPIQDST